MNLKMRYPVFMSWCIGSLCLVSRAAPVAVTVEGPAHARWGDRVSLRLASDDPIPTPRRCLASLTHRSTGAPAWARLPVTERRTEQSGNQPIFMQVRLPKAPDALGNQDGDFDLTLHVNSGTANYRGAYPIHIETRDADGRIRGKYTPRITDLIGANSAPARTTPEWLIETGIRHSREHCGWSEFQPQPNRWNEAALAPDSRFSTLILQARRYYMTILPLLCDIPEWAQMRDAEGKPLGGWGPPADPRQWESFVDRVVGHYSQPPYNQQDWQVWNEAQMNTGFWSGADMEQFIRTVYIPAARAIRRHYVDQNCNGREDPGERCRVVYGGYPCAFFNDGSYARVLRIENAGAWTDILDAHYMNGFDWFKNRQQSGDVYTEWHVKGPASGLWLTEEGDTFSADPVWLPTTFSRLPVWALHHSWSQPFQYRVFYFHYYMAQPQMGFLWDGQRKWPNGYAIRTYMHLMRGDLALPDKARMVQVSDNLDHCALMTGGRLTLCVWARQLDKSGEATVQCRLLPGETMRSVRRLSVIEGSSLPVSEQRRNGRVTITWQYAPIDRSPAGMESPLVPIQYLVLEFAGNTP